MTMKRWNGSAFVDTSTEKRWNGSAWVDLTVAKRWNGSAWVDIAFSGGGGGGLSATVNDGTVFGEVVDIGPAPAVVNVVSTLPSTVTVTPSGGTGPYTYSWSHVSGDSAVQVSSPTAATTQFNANVGKNQTKAAVKRCTVQDSLGATASVDVSVSLAYIWEPLDPE